MKIKKENILIEINGFSIVINSDEAIIISGHVENLSIVADKVIINGDIKYADIMCNNIKKNNE